MMKWINASILSIFAIFAPIKATLLTTAVLIGVDLITGVLAARKRGEKITSAGLRRTLSKVLTYEAALCLGFITETYLSDVLPFVKLVSAVISLVELKSVYENLNTISGQDLLSTVISKIGSENDNKNK